MGVTSQWWALSDLNGRPFGCKPNALTAELSALSQFIVQQAARGVNAPTGTADRNRPANAGMLGSGLRYRSQSGWQDFPGHFVIVIRQDFRPNPVTPHRH